MDNAVIHVSRMKTWKRDALTSYQVEIDGIIVAKLRPGQSYSCTVVSGVHTVRGVITGFGAEWNGSRRVAIECEPDKSSSILLSPRRVRQLGADVVEGMTKLTPAAWRKLEPFINIEVVD